MKIHSRFSLAHWNNSFNRTATGSAEKPLLVLPVGRFQRISRNFIFVFMHFAGVRLFSS